MNSWKFNSAAQSVLKVAVAKHFNIEYSDVYKKVTHIDRDFIYIKDKKYKVTLKEVKE